MLFNIMRVNRLSNCCATLRIVAGSWFTAPRLSELSPERSVYAGRSTEGRVMCVPSDHHELGSQGARLLERLENRHEISGGCAHLIDRSHDLIEIHTRLELEEPRVGLLHIESTARSHLG